MAQPGRGHYKIFLGMAAGVGKTYRMLQEGRQEQSEGRDVVIGYLEPHDRPETTALAEGLEVVPRLRAAHGGLEVDELDVDACGEHLLDVLPALLVPHPCGVRVRQLVDQRELGRATDDRVDVHLVQLEAAVRSPQMRHDLDATRQRRRLRAVMGLEVADDDITALLQRNLAIYGLGGVILPFAGIKLIDLVVHNLLGA